MRRRHAYTLTDLLAATTAVALLLALTAVTLANNGTARDRRLNATQLRSIHHGLVMFSNSNKEFFPGLTGRGDLVEDSNEATGNSGDGATPEARFWILLKDSFVTPQRLVAPVDERGVLYQDIDDAYPSVTYDNYSYAMLDIGNQDEYPGRRNEWTLSSNSQAAVMSDRNCSIPAEQPPSSIWHDNDWRGHILWNDGQVGYETTEVHATRYGNGVLNVDANGDPIDELFSLETESGDEAYMTFSRDEDGSERAVPRVVEDEE